MNYIQRLLSLGFLVCVFIDVRGDSVDPSGFSVRVLLYQADACVPVTVSVYKKDRLNTPISFKITDIQRKFKPKTLLVDSLTFMLKDGRLLVNGSPVATKTILIAASDLLAYAHRGYEGSFVVTIQDNRLYLINSVDIEQYIDAVVRWESIPTWPAQANQAAAIACRTYVVAKIVQARTKNNGKKILYDIHCTNIHQTYKGIHSFHQVHEAVKATRGLVLGYDKKPIMAMYDSCCGGVVPANLHDIDAAVAPYLARSYACTHCGTSKVYNWVAEYDLSAFNALMSAEFNNMVNIKDVGIAEKDSAGIVKDIKFKHGKVWLTIPGKRLYSLCKEIKSLCFSVSKKLQKIIFKGRGYGHHKGLCQWGACQMAKEGWNYKRILQFYYPGTTLMKVTPMEKIDAAL
jgi:stage II sporulation protein D